MPQDRTGEFYVTGGTLRPDAPSYVERQADRDLLDGLRCGEFCYVLTSRQMGKSSLMVRTAQKLREHDVTVVVLDLTAIGQNVSPEQWYDGLAVRIGQQLGLEDELEEFWKGNLRLSPIQRLFTAIRTVALARRAGPLVIFVDESDTVRSLPFSTDEFFAAVRECYNRRAEEAEFKRLTFCLLGVATPSDLIRDTRMTPFNIGRRVDLDDFTETEAWPLASGLARDESAARLILGRVLYWTGGQPYLTQRFCRCIAESSGAAGSQDVDGICAELFLSARGRERDDNLIFVRERILNSEVDRAALLDLYDTVRRGKSVADDEANPLVNVLKLSGVVRGEEGRLQLRNRIYGQVFNRGWVQANLPEAERRRQRVAYWRGAVGATIGLALLIALLSLPLFTKPMPQTVSAIGPQTNLPLPVVKAPTNPVVLLTLQGRVEVSRAGSTRWDLAYTNQVMEAGDRVRTAKNSRVMLRWPDLSLVSVGELSLLELPEAPDNRSALQLLRGVMRFFHRAPTNVFIRTPKGSGLIRG